MPSVWCNHLHMLSFRILLLFLPIVRQRRYSIVLFREPTRSLSKTLFHRGIPKTNLHVDEHPFWTFIFISRLILFIMIFLPVKWSWRHFYFCRLHPAFLSLLGTLGSPFFYEYGTIVSYSSSISSCSQRRDSVSLVQKLTFMDIPSKASLSPFLCFILSWFSYL